MGTSIVYPNAGQRKNWEKHGERVSLLDYMVVYPDPATALNAAITHGVTSRGGLSIQIPSNGIDGAYQINSPVLVNKDNILFYGEGWETSSFIRGANMPDGKGMFHITASNIKFRDLGFDGAVTTSVALHYSDFAFDPMNVLLTKNTTFWVKGNSTAAITDIKFDHIKISHTGGYAILLDATTGFIDRETVSNSLLINNRPHTFGVTTGDLGYGSWTGGIHYQSDGVLYGVNNLLVSNTNFERITGNCFWGHLYAFTTLHHNIRIKGCSFLDCGLDGTEHGGVSGGIVEGCTFRRIGYITSDDTSQSVPKLLPGANAVAMDTTGFVMGVNYVNNTSISANGGHLDLDGYTQGTVVGNKCRTPRITDPEYVEDQIGLSGWGASTSAGGPNFAYGINSNNSQDNQGGEGITVVGNSFWNLCGGSIRLFAGRYCNVTSNDIFAPSNSTVAPIVLGNTGASDLRRAYGNTVSGNRIDYSPVTPLPAIVETDNGFAFNPSDGNWVYNNQLTGTGTAVEFRKDPNTSSVTRSVFASNFGSSGNVLTEQSAHYIQREGRGADYSSALRWYHVEDATAPVLHMQLQGYRAATVREPLLNVSAAGALRTGVYATGNRTQSVFGDCIVTGKLYGDSMLCLTDTTYISGDAALLPSTVATMRYISGTGALQTALAAPLGITQVFMQLVAQSTLSRGFVTVSGGTSVSWDSGLKFNPWAAGAVLIINNAPYLLASVIDSTHATLASAAPNGSGQPWNLQSSLLNVSANGSGYTGAVTTGNRGTSAFDDAMLTGKMYADSLWCLAATTYSDVDANFLGASVGLFRYKSVSGSFQFQYSDSVTAGVRNWIPFSSGVAGTDMQVQYNKMGATAGDANLTWDYTNQLLVVQAKLAGQAGIAVGLGYIQSDGGFLATTATATHYNVFQSQAGGAYMAAYYTANSAANKGGYFQFLPLSYGTFPVPLSTWSFGATDVLLWAAGTNGTVSPVTTIGLMTNAYVNAAVGFVTLNTLYNSIQAPNGGLQGAGLGIAPNNSRGGYVGIVPLNYGTGGFPTALAPLSGFGGSDVLMWAGTVNGTTTPLTTVGLMTNAFIDAAVGFVTHNNLYNSIQAPNGGLQGAGVGIAPNNSVGGYLGFVPLNYGTGGFPTPLSPLSGFGATDVILWASGSANTAPLLSTVGLNTNAFINAAVGFVTLNTPNNSIQAPNGGVFAKFLTATDSVFTHGSMVMQEHTPPATPSAGTTAWYADLATHTLRISYNGAPYVTFGTGVPAGSDTWIQYNGAGVFAASTNLIWNNAAQTVVITGIAATAGLTVLNAYVSAAGGFVTSSGSYQSIQSPTGGLYVSGIGVTSTGGKGGYIDIPPLSYTGATPNFPVALASATFGGTDVLLWAGAVNGTPTPLSSVALNTNAFVNAAAGFFTGGAATNIIQAPNGGVTAKFVNSTNQAALATGGGVVLVAAASALIADPVATLQVVGYVYSTVGLSVLASAALDNTINVPGGGVTARRHIATYDIVATGVASGFPPPAAGQGKLYFDSVQGKWMVTQGTNAAVPMISGGAAGTTAQIQFNLNGTGTFGASVNLVWNNVPQSVVITGITATAGLTVLNAYISADGGFTTTNTSFQAIQSPLGGGYHAGLGITFNAALNRGGYIDIPPITYATFPAPLINASFGANDVLLWSSGSNGTPSPLTTIGLNTNAFINAAAGFVTFGVADNIIQAPNGGMTARRHITTYDIVGVGVGSGFPPPAAGQGKLYFDSVQNKWMVTQGTNAAVPMISGGGGLAAGAANQIQYSNGAGVFLASASHTWDDSIKRMSAFGVSNTAAIFAGTGFIQSDGGFLVTGTNTVWNTIQSSGGIRVSGSVQCGSLFTTDQSSAANGFIVHGMSSGVCLMLLDAFNTSGSAVAGFVGRYGNGSPGSMSPVVTGNQLMSMSGRGSIGPSSFTTSGSAAVLFQASENWNASANGAEILLQTTPNGATPASRATRVRIGNTGTFECFNGFYAHFGVLTDQGLYALTLGTGATPGVPSSGYAAFGHRSGSTWWVYNPSTAAYFIFDFAASGGGVTSIGALGFIGVGGAITLVPGSGIAMSQSGTNITINNSGSAAGFTATANTFGPFPGNGFVGGLYCGYTSSQSYLVHHDAVGGSSLVLQAQQSNGTSGSQILLGAGGGILVSALSSILLLAPITSTGPLSCGANNFTCGLINITNGSTVWSGATLNGGNSIIFQDIFGTQWTLHVRSGAITTT